MANRRRAPEPPPLEVRRFSTAQAERWSKLLETRIGEVKALDATNVRYDDERVRALERKIRSNVLEIFGENSREYRDHQYHEISGGGSIAVVGWGEDERYHDAQCQAEFAKGIPRTITMLEGLIDTARERTDAGPGAVAQPVVEAPIPGDGIFIVCGRKEGPREAVARFIAGLGLKPIILQEQANEGRTVIEKFERHATDVGYAVVLLTADDRGGLIDADPSAYAPRARQNVVLELGYFVGKLGRRRVCVVYEAGVEIPSDFHGVVYVPLDSGAWKLALAREMRVAGLDVDLNRAI